MSEPCVHDFLYQGVVYWLDDSRLPGSDARPRLYGDRYYCRKCLFTTVINPRTAGHSYGKPLEGTMPR